MSAPRRIGLVGMLPDGPWTLWNSAEFEGMAAAVEYLRADIAVAQVAAARAEGIREALTIIEVDRAWSEDMCCGIGVLRRVHDALRALIPEEKETEHG